MLDCVIKREDNMSEATFTFQLDETLMEQFVSAAKRVNRDVDEVLCDLMRDFIEQETTSYDAWLKRKIQASIDSANAGREVSAEEAEARFAAKRAELRRRHGL